VRAKTVGLGMNAAEVAGKNATAICGVFIGRSHPSTMMIQYVGVDLFQQGMSVSQRGFKETFEGRDDDGCEGLWARVFRIQE